MNTRILTKEEIIKLYEEQMPLDFPKTEIKPLEIMLKLFDQGIYIGYGLFEGNKMLGYSLFAKTKEKNWMLLDYYAICSQYRSNGYGSQFLMTLKNTMKKADATAMIIEIEKIECGKNKEEIELRKRRKEFYFKNEINTTGTFVTVFGTEFEILYYSYHGECDENEVIQEYRQIYKTMTPKKLYEENCFI